MLTEVGSENTRVKPVCGSVELCKQLIFQSAERIENYWGKNSINSPDKHFLSTTAPLPSHLILDWITYFVSKAVSAFRTAIQLLLQRGRGTSEQNVILLSQKKILVTFFHLSYFNSKELLDSLVLFDLRFSFKWTSCLHGACPAKHLLAEFRTWSCWLGRTSEGVCSNFLLWAELSILTHLSQGLVWLNF